MEVWVDGWMNRLLFYQKGKSYGGGANYRNRITSGLIIQTSSLECTLFHIDVCCLATALGTPKLKRHASTNLGRLAGAQASLPMLIHLLPRHTQLHNRQKSRY